MLRTVLAELQGRGRHGPLTAPELAARLGVTLDEVRLAMWQLERLGLLPGARCAGPSPGHGCAGCPGRDWCAAAAPGSAGQWATAERSEA